MHTGLQMLMVMEAMEWKHLPLAGGLYDQHPDFIVKMQQYMVTRAAYEKKKQDQEDRKKGSGRPSTNLGAGGRGPRRR